MLVCLPRVMDAPRCFLNSTRGNALIRLNRNAHWGLLPRSFNLNAICCPKDRSKKGANHQLPTGSAMVLNWQHRAFWDLPSCENACGSLGIVCLQTWAPLSRLINLLEKSGLGVIPNNWTPSFGEASVEKKWAESLNKRFSGLTCNRGSARALAG